MARIHTILNEYYVILEVDPSYQLGPNALRRIYAKSIGGGTVRSANSPQSAPRPLRWRSTTRGQFPSVTLSFNLAPNSTIGAAVSAVKKATAIFTCRLDRHQLPGKRPGVREFAPQHSDPDPRGVGRELPHPRRAVREHDPSARHHFDSALGRTWRRLIGMPLDVIGIIGITLLVGIVKKIGIMLVDFALAEGRDHGLSSEEATHRACLMRLRLTTPVVYIYMDRLSSCMKRRPQRNGAEAVVPGAQRGNRTGPAALSLPARPKLLAAHIQIILKYASCIPEYIFEIPGPLVK